MQQVFAENENESEGASASGSVNWLGKPAMELQLTALKALRGADEGLQVR